MAQSSEASAASAVFTWRGSFASPEVERLHSAGFHRAATDYDWRRQVDRHSLGWVCARLNDELVGWVNVAWDGAGHAFILDTVVEVGHRRSGIGARLVEVATEHARSAGCEWLHVDFEDHLTNFYLRSCGFTSTPAGVIDLTR